MANEFSMQATCTMAQTERLGAALARVLRVGDVVLLDGPLAAGKTTLTRAIVSGLNTQNDISSPTYTIAQEYQTQAGPVLHIDAYRLADSKALHGLGFDDFDDYITLIEWGEIVAEAFDAPAQINIALDETDETRRVISVRGPAHWAALSGFDACKETGA